MNRVVVARRLGLAVPLLALLSGCVALESNLLNPSAPPSPGVPCQVVATWQPEVYYPPDPAHGGVQSPALAGRVYLFGPEVGTPMTGDGSLAVVAYDGATQVGPDAVPLPGGVWHFDPETLHRLLKRDFVGWGYTVPLPWPDLPPDLTRVQLKACYMPAKGTPLYSDCAMMTLNKPAAAAIVTQSAKPHVR